ncbi:MAG: methyltransferase domain-containing protein [Deltaproteobacteria bacterium]|nr:methyltransferase domain-containing protein [Deltaproteobacteria bacterium]
MDEQEIQRINRIQREFFSRIVDVFEPPLPKNVPKRLRIIVSSADIKKGDIVLDIGTGTGILVPIIHKYAPGKIYACDLSEAMLKTLKENYPYAKTIAADTRDLTLPDSSIDVIFMNASYPNIVDKKGAFSNIGRMMKRGGRFVISHPMGKEFIGLLKDKSPFPLDKFPNKEEAISLFERFGFQIKKFQDDPELYILVGLKTKPLKCPSLQKN